MEATTTCQGVTIFGVLITPDVADKNADGTRCAHCGDVLGSHDYCPARSALRCSGGAR